MNVRKMLFTIRLNLYNLIKFFAKGVLLISTRITLLIPSQYKNHRKNLRERIVLKISHSKNKGFLESEENQAYKDQNHL